MVSRSLIKFQSNRIIEIDGGDFQSREQWILQGFVDLAV